MKAKTRENTAPILKENRLYEKNPFFKISQQKDGDFYVSTSEEHKTVTRLADFNELKEYLWEDNHYEDLEGVHTHFKEMYGRKCRPRQKEEEEEPLLKDKSEENALIINSLKEANVNLTKENARLLNENISLEREVERLIHEKKKLRSDARRMRRLDKILSNNNNGPTYLNRKNKHLGKKSNEGYFAHDTNFSKFKSPKYYVELKADEVKFFRRCDEFINGYNGNFKGHWR